LLGGASSGDALRQAMLALDGQRPQEAQRIAEDILASNPRHGRALHVLGCALLMQGRARDAVAPLETAARELREAETDTLLAIALRQAGHNDDALSQLKRTIKRRAPYAAAFYELGVLLSSLSRHDEAVEAFRRGLEIAPMMPEFSIQLGRAFLRRKNSAEAKLAFARALEISPGSPDALLGMASAHKGVGEDEAAADYLRRYLRVRPDDAEMWLNLGQCLLELGQSAAGYDCFRAVVRGDQRRYGSALKSLASSGRGRFWLRPSDAVRFLHGAKS
jgi:tetratricopeptide (TPR) repeat protein